ncbi:MAG: hypothetical protein AAGI88_08860 [Pseudomonadota bacterium]
MSVANALGVAGGARLATPEKFLGLAIAFQVSFSHRSCRLSRFVSLLWLQKGHVSDVQKVSIKIDINYV